MGVLQFGHALTDPVVDEALALPMSTPALDAVREAVAAVEDRQRVGWTGGVVDSTREPYRSLATELITSDFPARTEADARASTLGLTRQLLIRAIDRQKAQLLGAIQRVDASSEEGRAVRVSLRDLDAKRRQLTDVE